MAKKKHRNRKRDILLCIFIPIGILAFPFLLSLYLPYLRFFFFPFCNIQYPESGDLLAFYGVVLSISVSFLIYHLTKQHELRQEEIKYMQRYVPSLSIELYDIYAMDAPLYRTDSGDDASYLDCITENHAYELNIINRKSNLYTVERIFDTPTNIHLSSQKPHIGILQVGVPSKTNHDSNIYISQNFNYEEGYPDRLNLTILDDNNNFWDCFYRHNPENIGKYWLESADWSLKCKISEELIEK